MLNLNAVMAVIADVPAVVVRCFLSHRNAFIAAQSAVPLNADIAPSSTLDMYGEYPTRDVRRRHTCPT